MTENKRIVVNVVATYGRSLYALLCGLFTSRWLLMALGEVDYGLSGLVGGLTAFVVFLNGLMSESVARFYAYAVGEARVAVSKEAGIEGCRKWFSIAVGIHSVLPIVLVAIGYPCGVWAVRHFLTIPPDRIEACVWVWRFVCASCFVSMISVPFNAMYTAKQEIAELTVYSFAGSTVFLILVFIMTLSQRDWLAYYAFVCCVVAVVPQFIISIRAVYKYPECRFRYKYLKGLSNWRELVQYSGVRFFSALSQLLTAQGMAIVVNKMFGPARNAAMAIGNNLSGKTLTLTMSFRGALQPAIANATGAGDDKRANTLTYMTCQVSVLGVLIFAIPLVLEVDEVMILWLKKPPAGAGLLCQILMAGIFVDELTIGHVMRLFASGKIVAFQVIETFVWISALFIAWGWFAAGGDIEGVGIGFLCMYAIDNLVKLYCARRHCGLSIRHWVRHIVLPSSLVAVLALGVGLIPVLLLPQSFMRLVITTGVVEIAYLPLVWFFALGNEEREFVRAKVFNRFLRKRK